MPGLTVTSYECLDIAGDVGPRRLQARLRLLGPGQRVLDLPRRSRRSSTLLGPIQLIAHSSAEIE